MKQWIIDRYNKGQDKYKLISQHKNSYDEDVLMFSELKKNDGKQPFMDSTHKLYDFLFNPKWGFAKAYWEKYPKIGGHSYSHTKQTYKFHLQQMVISPDPLEYLEQFKEATNSVEGE